MRRKQPDETGSFSVVGVKTSPANGTGRISTPSARFGVSSGNTAATPPSHRRRALCHRDDRTTVQKLPCNSIMRSQQSHLWFIRRTRIMMKNFDPRRCLVGTPDLSLQSSLAPIKRSAVTRTPNVVVGNRRFPLAVIGTKRDVDFGIGL